MSTITVTTAKVTTTQDASGGQSVTLATTLCKAWAHFETSGTQHFNLSYNMASITDTGTGEATLTYTNAMNDAQHVIVQCAGEAAAGGNRIVGYRGTDGAQAATDVHMGTFNMSGSVTDVDWAATAMFGALA